MKYEEILDECKELLRNAGLPVPDVHLSETLTEDVLSSITGDKISIGLGARLRHRLLGRWTMEETLLHELLHGLVDMKFPPKCVRDAFGDDEEWDQDQNLLRWLADPDDYVSRYAATHPEEDLIETAKAVLLGKPLGRRNAVQPTARGFHQEEPESSFGAAVFSRCRSSARAIDTPSWYVASFTPYLSTRRSAKIRGLGVFSAMAKL